MDVEDWLLHVGLYLRVGNCAGGTAVDAAATYLAGGARRFWNQARPAGRDPTWDEFASALKERYVSSDRKQRARLELRSLRQTGRLDTYVNKFDECLSLLDVSMDDRLHLFFEGLSAELKPMLMSDPTTGKFWVSYAQLRAAALSANALLRSPRVPPPDGGVPHVPHGKRERSRADTTRPGAPKFAKTEHQV